MASKPVVLRFLGDTTSLDAAFKRVDASSKAATTGLQKLHTGAKVLSAALLGGLAVAAKAGFSEFMQGQKSTAALTAALGSAKHTASLTTKSIEDMATALQNKSGIDDDAINHAASLALGFTTIRNNAKLFNATMQDAVDISKKYGISVDAAAKLAAKALSSPLKGMTALGKVGVVLTDAEKKHVKALVASGQANKAAAILQDKLTQSVGGSATAYGKTLAGQMDIAKQQAANLAGSLISVVMPAFQAVIGVISSVVGWLQRHQTVAKVLIGVLSGLAAGVWLVNAAVKAYTAVQLVLDAVMTANPIGIVVLALVGLTAAFVVAWKKSETFRDIVKGALDAVKTVAQGVADFFTKDVPAAFEAVLSWLRGNWQSIATIISGPFAPLVALATDAFGIRTALVGAFNAVKNWIGDRISDIVGLVGGIGSRVKAVASGAFDALLWALKPFVTAVQDAIGLVQTFLGLFGRANTVQTQRFATTVAAGQTKSPVNPRAIAGPPAPHALGGVFSTPHVGLIAEAGPEAVIPLTRPGRAASIMRQAGLGGGGGGGGSTYNIVVNAMDPQAAATAVIRAIDAYESRNGRRFARA